MASVAFQSIWRKQIRKLPKFLKSVKIIQYYSILFNRVLRREGAPEREAAAPDDVRRRHGDHGRGAAGVDRRLRPRRREDRLGGRLGLQYETNLKLNSALDT